jgi:hypothetical protein
MCSYTQRDTNSVTMADTGDNLVCIEQLRAAHADLYRNRETQTDLLWERLWQTTNSEYGKFATRPECKTASCQGVTAEPASNNNNDNNNSFNGNTQYQQTSTDYGTGCVRFSDDVTYSDGQQTWQAADGCNTDGNYGNYTNYLNTVCCMVLSWYVVWY